MMSLFPSPFFPPPLSGAVSLLVGHILTGFIAPLGTTSKSQASTVRLVTRWLGLGQILWKRLSKLMTLFMALADLVLILPRPGPRNNHLDRHPCLGGPLGGFGFPSQIIFEAVRPAVD